MLTKGADRRVADGNSVTLADLTTVPAPRGRAPAAAGKRSCRWWPTGRCGNTPQAAGWIVTSPRPFDDDVPRRRRVVERAADDGAGRRSIGDSRCCVRFNGGSKPPKRSAAMRVAEQLLQRARVMKRPRSNASVVPMPPCGSPSRTARSADKAVVFGGGNDITHRGNRLGIERLLGAQQQQRASSRSLQYSVAMRCRSAWNSPMMPVEPFALFQVGKRACVFRRRSRTAAGRRPCGPRSTRRRAPRLRSSPPSRRALASSRHAVEADAGRIVRVDHQHCARRRRRPRPDRRGRARGRRRPRGRRRSAACHRRGRRRRRSWRPAGRTPVLGRGRRRDVLRVVPRRLVDRQREHGVGGGDARLGSHCACWAPPTRRGRAPAPTARRWRGRATARGVLPSASAIAPASTAPSRGRRAPLGRASPRSRARQSAATAAGRSRSGRGRRAADGGARPARSRRRRRTRCPQHPLFLVEDKTHRVRPRQAEDALGDDVELDFALSALDQLPLLRQPAAGKRPSRERAPSQSRPSGARRRDGQLLAALVQLGADVPWSADENAGSPSPRRARSSCARRCAEREVRRSRKRAIALRRLPSRSRPGGVGADGRRRECQATAPPSAARACRRSSLRSWVRRCRRSSSLPFGSPTRLARGTQCRRKKVSQNGDLPG